MLLTRETVRAMLRDTSGETFSLWTFGPAGLTVADAEWCAASRAAAALLLAEIDALIQERDGSVGRRERAIVDAAIEYEAASGAEQIAIAAKALRLAVSRLHITAEAEAIAAMKKRSGPCSTGRPQTS